MADSFTETTSISWFGRLKKAFGGIVMGFILVFAAIAGLFWNEGRAVKTANALAEGAGLVVTIDPASPPADANGKLVHFSGDLTPMGVPEDKVFAGIKAPEGATRLTRTVEMFQWKENSKSETRKKLGGGEETVTTYTYETVWSDRAIDSSRFKEPAGHQNPPMPYQSEGFGVEKGSVGAIELKGSSFSGLGEKTALTPTEQMTAIIQNTINDGRIARVSGSAVLLANRADATQVGDMRISFESNDVDKVSTVGLLKDGAMTEYTTSNGRTISMTQAGSVDAKQMFDKAMSDNTLLTWGLRVGGFLAMLIGFNMIFAVVGVIGDVIPMVGDVFRFATGLAATALAAIISALVIGIAWITFRPVVGISIIAAGIILAIGSFAIGKAKARGAAQETAAASA